MAQDYLGILASSCLAEQSFSMSARIDEAWHHQMGSELDKKISLCQNLGLVQVQTRFRPGPDHTLGSGPDPGVKKNGQTWT